MTNKDKELKNEIEKELNNLIFILKTFIPKEQCFLFKGRIGRLMDKAELKGRQEARKEILKFIETERDNGNIIDNKGFSASLCLSKLIKELEKKQ